MDVENNIKVPPHFFMSVLAKRFKTVIDWGVCCSGHRKSIIDAINGIDKDAILRLTTKYTKPYNPT